MGGREGFNQAIGEALTALRLERGLSQAEVAEGINTIPEIDRQERGTRAVAGYAALSIILRNEQGLTQEELAKRSQVPFEFVCDLETGQNSNPDCYFLYCLSAGFNLPFTEFAHRAEELSNIPMTCFWRTKPTKREGCHEQSTGEDDSPRA